MHIHEYQAKKILLKYGIPTPSFEVASNENEIKTVRVKTAQSK